MLVACRCHSITSHHIDTTRQDSCSSVVSRARLPSTPKTYIDTAALLLDAPPSCQQKAVSHLTSLFASVRPPVAHCPRPAHYQNSPVHKLHSSIRCPTLHINIPNDNDNKNKNKKDGDWTRIITGIEDIHYQTNRPRSGIHIGFLRLYTITVQPHQSSFGLYNTSITLHLLPHEVVEYHKGALTTSTPSSDCLSSST